MSWEVEREQGEMPSVTAFWGGEKRGRCIQLTKHEAQTYGYITIKISKIDTLIGRLEKVKKRL